MSPDDPRHGTRAGYYAHRRDDETACPDCKHAAAKAEVVRLLYGPRRTSALGTARRIQALVALGWNYATIEAATGLHREDTRGWASDGQQFVFVTTARKVAAAYDALSMRHPPRTTRAERQSYTKAINQARRRGWLPPLAWDDIDTDPEPPTADPDTSVDPVVVMRLLEGQRVKDANHAEKEEALARWVCDGGSKSEFCDLHGWNDGRFPKVAELRLLRGGAA